MGTLKQALFRVSLVPLVGIMFALFSCRSLLPSDQIIQKENNIVSRSLEGFLLLHEDMASIKDPVMRSAVFYIYRRMNTQVPVLSSVTRMFLYGAILNREWDKPVVMHGKHSELTMREKSLRFLRTLTALVVAGKVSDICVDTLMPKITPMLEPLSETSWPSRFFWGSLFEIVQETVTVGAAQMGNFVGRCWSNVLAKSGIQALV